ncbi:MAG: HPr family phosphocarrier protein [Butyricicoccus sp.]|nr:HPr family phosphocarrier protein [Butyricicoccus sp.]
MRTFTYVITDPIGIHARPAGQLVKKAQQFESKIVIEHNGVKSEATRLMSLMGMGIRHGDTVQVTIEGVDEEKALEQMQAFFQEAL